MSGVVLFFVFFPPRDWCFLHTPVTQTTPSKSSHLDQFVWSGSKVWTRLRTTTRLIIATYPFPPRGYAENSIPSQSRALAPFISGNNTTAAGAEGSHSDTDDAAADVCFKSRPISHTSDVSAGLEFHPNAGLELARLGRISTSGFTFLMHLKGKVYSTQWQRVWHWQFWCSTANTLHLYVASFSLIFPNVARKTQSPKAPLAPLELTFLPMSQTI